MSFQAYLDKVEEITGKAPKEFVGRTLRDLALRNTLNVQLVAIQHDEGGEKRINIVPHADDKIRTDDLLILLGENRDLDRIRDIVKHPPLPKAG